jgi:UDP-glucuronate 4-epimerase
MEMIAILENLLGRKAILDLMPAQPGEVPITYADVTAIEADFGFRPEVSLERGLTRFVEWYRRYNEAGGVRRSR